MREKCENCGELNYLTEFKVGDFSRNLCSKCNESFKRASDEVKQAFFEVTEKEKLRVAFGKMGE